MKPPFPLSPASKHHSLNGSSDSVNGDLPFLGIGKFHPSPHKINTPEPIDKKFGTVDYVREGTPYTEFGTNPPTEGFWANGWNGSRKGVPHGGLNDVPQILGVKLAKKLKFWGSEIRTFKPELQQFQTLITWNLLIRSWRNFYMEHAPWVCLRGWSHGSPTNPRWRRSLSLISAKCQ